MVPRREGDDGNLHNLELWHHKKKQRWYNYTDGCKEPRMIMVATKWKKEATLAIKRS